MRIQDLGDDLQVFVGNQYQANTTLLRNGEEGLLVDALGSAADGNELRDHLTRAGIRVRLIVCTHYFSDHLAALKLFPEALIIAHSNFSHSFEFEHHRTAEELDHFVPPSIEVGDSLRLRWGRFDLEIFHNPGHTMSTLGIDVPSADLIFGGDTAVGHIVYLSYGTPLMIDRALECLIRRGRKTLITSHWEARPATALETARGYLHRLAELTRKGDGDVASDDCLPADVRATEFERFFHQRNLEHVAAADPFARWTS